MRLSVKVKFSFMGAAQRRGSILASYPAALGLIFTVPNNFSLDVAEIY